jgi:ubiquinone/menaquinone biosynthesis C-methylase UbiE
MNIQQAYDGWAEQYDSNENKTRDLEAFALRDVLKNIHFDSVLEAGCGTGKNTVWFAEKAQRVTAVDFSEEMLKHAKERVHADNVEFFQADLLNEWNFTSNQFDLCSFSLVLEHIENLEQVFSKAADKLFDGGYLFIGELHPFKQYTGSKARFISYDSEQVLTCYTHHISDFIEAANSQGFQLVTMKEYFDDGDRTTTPRIIALLFYRQ